MSRLITIMTITAIAISISICGIFYCKDTNKQMHEMTNAAISDCYEKNINGLTQNEKRLSAFFQSRQPFLCLYVRHDEIEKMQTLLAVLPGHIRNHSFDEIATCLYQINFTIEHIYKRELPSLHNLL